MQDRAGRADRTRQTARDGPDRAAARLGCHRGQAARPVRVNSRVGRVHPGSNLGYIRRTIKPALGSTQVRKVRGPLLDTLYARLMPCGNLACTGKPFTEHRNILDLRPDPADPRLEWEQAADRVREAIRSGQLASGDALPSVPDLARFQGLKPGTVRHMFLALAKEGLVHIQHGRTTTIAGEPRADEPGSRLQISRPRPGHDRKLSGCHPHVCKPMAKGTIRGIHAILSGAFEAAMRWEWTDRNPAASARPPTPRHQTILATSPEAVAKVIAEARARSAALGLYLWLVMVTGVRRSELCGLQIRDVDLDRGLVHVAFNYVVRGGHRIRKDTKTHQDRWLAIDPDTCALITSYLDEIRAELGAVGVGLRDDAYLFSNDPAHSRPWNPDWATHRVAETADAAGVRLDIKGGRHYCGRQPAPRRRLRLAEHCRTPTWLQRRRRDHAAALRRPGSRGRPARRRVPRETDRRIRSQERLTLAEPRIRPTRNQGRRRG